MLLSVEYLIILTSSLSITRLVTKIQRICCKILTSLSDLVPAQQYIPGYYGVKRMIKWMLRAMKILIAWLGWNNFTTILWVGEVCYSHSVTLCNNLVDFHGQHLRGRNYDIAWNLAMLQVWPWSGYKMLARQQTTSHIACAMRNLSTHTPLS